MTDEGGEGGGAKGGALHGPRSFVGPSQIDDTTKENVPAALYFAEYLASHKDADFLNHTYADDVATDANKDGLADWFPTCFDPQAPRCLTPAKKSCHPDIIHAASAAPAATPAVLPMLVTGLVLVFLGCVQS